jgi:hypothetical protein
LSFGTNWKNYNKRKSRVRFYWSLLNIFAFAVEKKHLFSLFANQLNQSDGNKLDDTSLSRLTRISSWLNTISIQHKKLNSPNRKFYYKTVDTLNLDNAQKDLKIAIDHFQNHLNKTPIINQVSESNARAYVRLKHIQKPVWAFISHDSRDKNIIARPLAQKLTEQIGRVWFDEFSLKLGASLRESIEKGIKECHKCILIISPNFLSNDGWTKTEFNSVFTREMIERENVIIPVWAGVSVKEVYNYSPTLADKFAVNWSEGLDVVCQKIKQAIFDDSNS